MSKNTLSLVIAAVVALAIVAGGWFLGVQPQLAAASTARSQRVTTEESNRQSRAELGRLAEEYKSLDAKKQTLAALQASIPDSTSTNDFIKQVNTVAQQSTVTISALNFGAVQAYTAPATAATTAAGTTTPAATSAPSASASASPSAAPTPSGPAAPAPATDPSITAANFSVIPVTIAVTGSDAQSLAFVEGMQTGRRLFLVNSLSSGAGQGQTDDGAAVMTKSWTLGGYIYILKTADQAAAAPAAHS